VKYFLVLILFLVSFGYWLHKDNEESIEEYTDVGEQKSWTIPKENLDNKPKEISLSNEEIDKIPLGGENYVPTSSNENDIDHNSNDESAVITMDIGPSEIYSSDDEPPSDEGVSPDDNRSPANE
jgi:hypothetical protein